MTTDQESIIGVQFFLGALWGGNYTAILGNVSMHRGNIYRAV